MKFRSIPILSIKVILSALLIFSSTIFPLSLAKAEAESITLIVAEDYLTGYDRSLFKHWIDADKNGCDTRAEVLIQEALVAPKKGKKCALTGGKWMSAYDGKITTSASGLDIDHLVPLAEAWRSGAWAWTPKEREKFANDLTDKRVLSAVTASINRSKGDKDVVNWLPSLSYKYVCDWIAVKSKYKLTIDKAEAAYLEMPSKYCGFTSVFIGVINNSTGAKMFEMPEMIGFVKWFKDANRWKSYGFINLPTIQQMPPSNSSLLCKPISDDDYIVLQMPKIGEYVDVNTQVVLTVGCNSYVKDNPFPSSTPTPNTSSTQSGTPTSTPTPQPSQSTGLLIVTPGAFCSPAGASGQNAKGVKYTCKTSSTDTRNRWRQ
jgi:hypothetical protein